MGTFVENLIERRVPQFVAIYLGASWGLVQFTQFIVEEYLFSTLWVRVALYTAALLLPSVVLLSWGHGRKGKDRWNRLEKVAVPTNVVLTVALLFFVFGGSDLGSAAVLVQVEDETGETFERAVAKPEFRTRVVAFAFDPEDGETDTWMSYLVPFAIAIDLKEHLFLELVGYDRRRFLDAGFATLTGMPFPLKLEVASEVQADKLLSGTVARTAEGVILSTELHEVSDGSPISSHRYEGPELLALIDELTVDLRGDLNARNPEGFRDLPVADLLTSNADALAAYGRGLQLLETTTDREEALNQLLEAANADATFAVAQHTAGDILAQFGRNDEAVNRIRQALEHDYRLPEPVRFEVKEHLYTMSGDLHKAGAVVEMWSELYPEDTRALSRLVGFQKAEGDSDGALESLQTILELSPSDSWTLAEIASIHERRGEYQPARAALESYVEQLPEAAGGYQRLARLARSFGEHATARSDLERAMLLEPENVFLLLDLATLDHNDQQFESAEQTMKEALELATSDRERSSVWGSLQAHYKARGRLDAAMAAMRSKIDQSEYSEELPSVLWQRFGDLELLVEAGSVEEAKRLVAKMNAQFQPPYSNYLPFVELELALLLSEVERFEEALPLARERATGALAAWSAQVDFYEGQLAKLEQDCDAALPAFQRALRQGPNRRSQLAIARCQRTLGQLDDAATTLLDLLKRFPASGPENLEMARVLIAQGNPEEALASLDRALEVWAVADSDFAPAEEARELRETLTL